MTKLSSLFTGGGIQVAPGAANLKLFMDATGVNTEWASGMKIGSFTRAMDAVSGDVSYSGVGFKPSALIVIATVNGADSNSIGFDVNLTGKAMVKYLGADTEMSDNLIFNYSDSSASYRQYGSVKSYDSDGFTITWTNVGPPPSATMNVSYIAFR